jgi:hypothetical protein
MEKGYPMLKALAFIILFILLLAVLYKIIKSLIKVAIIAVIIILISLGAFGFMFYKDLKDMRSFGNESNLFVLRDNGVILSAFQSENGTGFQEMTYDERKTIGDALSSGDTKALEDAHGRIFVFKMEFFEGLPDEVQYSADVTVMRADVLEMLRTGVIPGYEGEDKRTEIFALAVGNIMDERGLGYALQQYRTKNLEVYPQTILFSVVRWTPEFMLRPFFDSDKL